MSVASSAVVEHPPRSRSRFINRRFELPGISVNTEQGRYFRDLCLSYASEITADPSTLTEADLTLIRSTAGLALEASRLQAAIVAGKEPIDHEQLTRVNNSLTRNLTRLKQRRRTRSSAPSLASMLREPA